VQIAYYFAFTQSYFQFLLFPAVFGFSAWVMLGHFSPIYAMVSCLWCIVFTEYWKHQEVDLAIRWGVRGVSKIESQRLGFVHTKEITDPITGQKVRWFPATSRLRRQVLQVPFALTVAVILGSLIATCFGIEIFISEIYDGPLKSMLVFLPTGILTVFMPVLVGILTTTATKLTDFENYETHGAYETALTSKLFIINFITSYLGIFLTAFVYVPFGTLIVPYLDIFSLTVKPFAEHEKQFQVAETGFKINPDRLRKQVIYFTVTAQVVNFCLELIVPYLKRQGLIKFKEMQNDYAAKHGGVGPQPGENDPPEEAAFLARVRKEAELGVYDVTSDLREMVLQFGYLSLFSVVWPLTAVSFVVNDWIELRADALKITLEMQRPIPWRADTIGPWLDSLSFLTWLGSLTTSALVYLFSNDGLGPDGSPYDIKGWALLLAIIFSEHLFFVTRWAVRVAIQRLESPGLQKERRERYLVRRKYFDESIGELEKKKNPLKDAPLEMPTRESLEEDARKGSLKSASAEDRFWGRQRGWRECVEVGVTYIERAAVGNETKKEL
jgi:anoctamin-10